MVEKLDVTVGGQAWGELENWGTKGVLRAVVTRLRIEDGDKQATGVGLLRKLARQAANMGGDFLCIEQVTQPELARMMRGAFGQHNLLITPASAAYPESEQVDYGREVLPALEASTGKFLFQVGLGDAAVRQILAETQQ